MYHYVVSDDESTSAVMIQFRVKKSTLLYLSYLLFAPTFSTSFRICETPETFIVSALALPDYQIIMAGLVRWWSFSPEKGKSKLICAILKCFRYIIMTALLVCRTLLIGRLSKFGNKEINIIIVHIVFVLGHY